MSKIKNFFLKKKEEAAFKLGIGGVMGQGHTLSSQNVDASTSRKPVADAYIPPVRRELSNEARAAASAALERVEKKNSKDFNTSLAHIKAQAKKEIEAERRMKEEKSSPENSNKNNCISNTDCRGVFFRCPMISEEVLSKEVWKAKIKAFLYQQLEAEKALTSCLIIHNCNSKEKAEDCIKTLAKYLTNIIQFPDEEKFYRIRMLNRVFCEKVRDVEGALDFLQAAGFYEVKLDDENFLIWSKENVEKNYDLNTLLEALQNSEPIKLILDRNLKILLPSQAKNVVLPPDFYRISQEEIKREQRLRTETIESAQILKTKATREREEQRVLRMYKYSLVRVKFPNGIFIQGTFSVYEKLSDIFEFVQSCLQDETLDFELFASTEKKFTEEDVRKSLYDLRLVPNIVLLFNTLNKIASSDQEINFIKEDLLLLIECV